jgi:hypothetical protein
MTKRIFAALAVSSISTWGVLGCSSDKSDGHETTSMGESQGAGDIKSEIGAGSVGAACTVPEGGDGTDTTQCPYFACYCKNATEPVLCTDYCKATESGAATCQDADATCAFECRDLGGVDHVGPATHTVCD